MVSYMSTRYRNGLGLLILGSALTGSMVWRATIVFSQSQSLQVIDFNRDIRPILSDTCFTCHGPDAANRKTKLRFDTEAGAFADLGGYRAIVPGDLAKSEMYRRVASKDEAVRMPPVYAG